MNTIDLLQIIYDYFRRCAEGNEDFRYYDEYEATEYLEEVNEASGEELTFEEAFDVRLPEDNEYLVYVINGAGEGKAYIVDATENSYYTLKEAVEYITQDRWTLEHDGEIVKA